MPSLRTNSLVTVLAATLLATAALTAPAVGAQEETAEVTIEEQTSGGTTVEVAQVQLPGDGFLTLHDPTLADGEVLGSVVGASEYLPAGTHEDVSVHLSEPLSEDTALIAMPHKDTDGDQAYTFVSSNGEADGPYTADGGAVTDQANVTISASVNGSDQPTDGNSVIVDSVEMAQGGFVAVHDDRLLEGEAVASVVGHSDFLEAGVHHDVRVNLTRTIAQEETLIFMPHEDSNNDETYDFVTSGGMEDPPYTNGDGDAVVDDAQVSPSDEADATFEDQTTGGTNLYVAEVFLPEGGFVTMHDSSLTEGAVFESVRGTSECLDPGVHRHVFVQLDDTLEEDDTLFAMPHKDTNDNCSYDFVDNNGEDDGPYTSGGEAVTDDAEITVSAGVHYHGQTADGRTIEVSSADLSEGGFVAVHDASLLAGEVTGSVVGHSQYLEPGAHENLEIRLGEPIQDSQTLIPMPHRDTDGDEEYTFLDSEGSTDGPYTTADGGAVVDTGFTVVRSQVTIQDQKSEDGVHVESVTMHDGGFLTLHDDSLLDGEVTGSVVGVSEKLTPGTHEHMEVSLDESIDGEATIIAMPHRDTNDNGAYDFVDSGGETDGPYVSDAGAVVDSATVDFGSDETGDDRQDTGARDGGTPDQDADGQDSRDDAPSPGLGLLLAALACAAALRVRSRE